MRPLTHPDRSPRFLQITSFLLLLLIPVILSLDVSALSGEVEAILSPSLKWQRGDVWVFSKRLKTWIEISDL